MKTNKLFHIFIIALVLLQSLVYPWISILPAPPGVRAEESPPTEATNSGSTPAPSPLEPNSLDQILNQTLSTSTQSAETPIPEAIPEATPSASPEAIPESLPSASPHSSTTPTSTPTPSPSEQPENISQSSSPLPSSSPTQQPTPSIDPIVTSIPVLSPFAISLSYPFSGTHPISYRFGESSPNNFISAMQSIFGVDAHDGIDFSMPVGTPIHASSNGIIVSAGSGIYGTTIIIQHPWGTSYYGHLSEISVTRGDSVGAGQIIGYSGNSGISTGPHLHFGIKPTLTNYLNGFHGMIDPAPYLEDIILPSILGTKDGKAIHKRARVRQIKNKFALAKKSLKNDDTNLKVNFARGESSDLNIVLTNPKGYEVDITNETLGSLTGPLGPTLDVNLTEVVNLVPGLYQLTITDAAGNYETQDFTWGVLAINTNKTVYLPSTPVDFSMAVLDNQGDMVCDAQVDLSITSPSGQITRLSSTTGEVTVNLVTCLSKTYTLNPDYQATYHPSELGNYEVNMSTTTADGTRSISSNFSVAPSVPFDIERVTITRIYPRLDYPVILRVHAFEDYIGTVEDVIPSNFELIKPSGDTNPEYIVTPRGDIQVISWNVVWQKGHDYVLTYQFNPPDKSPDFYTLGPLKIGNRFSEIKKWQLAIDVTTTIILNYAHTILTSGTTWTVPADWTSGNNTIEVIGGGGAGRTDTGGVTGAGGGGGGAYAKSVNISLTPGASIDYQIGQGGIATSVNGTDTFFNRTSGTAGTCADTTSACAKGGTGATNATGTAGGTAASSYATGTGNVKNNGGTGGTGHTTSDSGGGGGGAGGPNGAGGTGGAGDTDNATDGVGGGGGGNGGGAAGGSGITSDTVGANGGNGNGGSGGGTGGTAADGANGTANTGGGGGGGADNFDGGNGANGNDLVSGANVGSGGGGGGTGDTSTTAGMGGNGGLYGGGGGGGRYGGFGAPGVIIITYNGNTPTKNTWVVPADWNSSDNTVTAIGGGAAGRSAAQGTGSGGSGGGGYSKSTNLSLTLGANIDYQIGSGGRKTTVGAGNGENGGATFFNRTAGTAGTCADTVSVCANGGTASTGTTGGAGGSTTGADGSTLFAGGAGGDGNSTGDTSGGGGGAGGTAVGQVGGAGPATTPSAGGGGGGGAGGTSSSVGQVGQAATGGTGGNGPAGTGSGAAGNAGHGGAGGSATGGGGGGGDDVFGGGVGGSGSSTTYGGGGGGGAGDNNTAATSQAYGGFGGLHGGGGGGGLTNGFGAEGIIIITYTPAEITIGGTANGNDGATVKWAKNGTVQASTATIGSGTWTITAITPPPASGDIITVWVDAVTDANETTAVTKWSSGNITGMVLNTNVVTVGSNQDQSLSLTNLNSYDCTEDEDIMYQAASSHLKVEGDACAGSTTNTYTSEKLEILSGDTLTVATSETVTTYDMTITGTLTSSGNSTYNVSHDWASTGTFTSSTSTVNLTGVDSSTQTLSGSTSFNNLTISTSANSAGRTITHTAGTTQTVTGTWTVTGFSGKVITLQSSAASAWTVNPTASSVSYVTVSYSTNSGAGFCATYSTSGGNNTNWNITSAAACTSDIAGTANGNNAATVKVAINGTTQAQTTTIGSGTWTITGVAVAANDIVTVWVDGVADSLESTGATKYVSGNVSGMVLNTNVVSIGSNQNSSLTLTNLDLFDCNNDEDVMYQAANSQLNVEGTSCSGTVNNSYATENINILSSNTLTIGTTETLNTYDITVTGTLTSGGNSIYNVAHNWASTGTFTKSTSTVNLNGDINSTQTISGSNNFNNLTSNNSGWYNASWTYRQKITIDHSKVGGDQYDFPVYINLANLPSGFHTHVNQTDARDIRVTKADGTTELPREVVFYTAASDTGELHFKYTGALSSTVDTDVYIYYGNAGASDYAVTATYGAQNVWDNSFAGVWHLQESSGTRYDSTSNDNDLSVVNTVGSTTSGVLGTSASLPEGVGHLTRSDANLATGFPSKNSETTTNYTASFWQKSTTLAWNDMLGKSNGNGWGFYDNTTAAVRFNYVAASSLTVASSTSSLSTGTWSFISSVHNAATDTDYMYIDGAQDGVETGRTGDPDSNTASFMIGGTDAWPSDSDGLFDEVRVSKSARSATWTSTEYNNQFASATFYSINGAESSNGSHTISFTAGTTQTITGTWTVAGVSGSPVILGSTSSSVWTIKPTTVAISYATVSKSINNGTSICATYSTDSGSNESWSFASTTTCKVRQVSNNVSTTTTNTSFEQMENMTITPGAGDYMINFSTSIKKSVGASIQEVSVFVAGSQVTHTARLIGSDSSYDAGNISSNPLAIQAYVSGVTSSDAIEVRWKTSAGTATAYERTLTIQSVTASDMAQATATGTVTTTSATDTQLTSMTLTPGAGNYIVYFSGSMSNNTMTSDIYYSIYVNSVQVAHSERYLFTEDSFAGVTYPVSTQAYVSNVGASDVIEVKWRTNTGTASAYQRTLTTQRVSSSEMSQATATSDTTSTSATDVQMGSMTLTPGAGDYIAYFSTSITNTDVSGSTQNISMYVASSQATHSEREVYTEESFATGAVISFPTSTVAYITNVGASDVVEVKWRTTGGTITAHARTLTLQKITYHGSTATSYQRKTWYDGTRYWRSFQDPILSRITFEYSTDGTTWTEDTSARVETNTNDFSVQATSTEAYLAYKTGAVTNEDNLLTSNLVGFWKMDETAANTCAGGTFDTCDSSGNNLNGTWFLDATSTTGKFGNGTTFDGTNDILGVTDPGTASVLDFSSGSSVTFSAWINPTTLPTSGTWQTIIHKGKADTSPADNSNYYFQIGNDAGTYVLSLCFMDTSDVMRCWNSGSATLATSSWQHIAISFTYGTGGSIKAYKNGTLLSAGTGWTAGTGSETVKTNNEPLFIGANYSETVDEEYNGKLDDVRIYSTTVSANDIAALASPGYDIEVRKASSYPGTGFTWGSPTVAFNGASATDYYQYPVLAQDTNSKIWAGASRNVSSTYTFNASRSTSASTITAWDTATSLDSSANSNKYGSLASGLSGAVYATWIDSTTIEGKNYNGTSWDGSPTTIATGTTGLTTTLSTLGDSNGYIHLLYIDSSGYTIYRKYITSWSNAVTLDENAGNTYPTLSLNTTDGDLYAFWVRSNNIYYKKGDFLSSGNALLFDGTADYVNVPYNASLDYATNLTVEFWFTPGTTINTGLSTYKGILSKAYSNTDADNDWVFFWASTEAGKLRFGTYGDNVKTTTDTWTAGTWYHVAATVDGSNNAYIYVNGVQDNYGGDTTVNGNPINGSQNTPLNIGLARIASGDTYFEGKIDDVRIYNTARTAAQIRSDMYSELAGSETNLQAYWKMNAGSGQTVADSTSNAYDGTLGATSGSSTDDPSWSSTIPFSNSWDQSATSWKTSGINAGVTTNYSGANQIFGEWSDGTIINWDMLTISSNTAPNSPSSLAQKTVADATISTGSWVSATSIKFTATATDTDNPDTLYLCVEKDDVGTAFSNTEDSCGSGVSYTGSGVALSATIASQTDATEYHWQARVKDSAGAYSSWVSYGANSDTTPGAARDYGLDTTAPTSGTVYDGTSVGVDATFSDSSLSALSANWGSFNNNVSGLNKYEYSIGTTVGGTDIKTWTDNTTSTTVTATGLTLHTSLIYYVNVRATDNAGNVSSVISSNGQIVAPSLSFTVSPASITFSNLGPLNSYTDTQTTTLTTSTNAYNGYVVRAFITDYLRNGATTIADFSPGTYSSPATWSGAETGFGYTSSDTTIGGSNKFSSGTLYAPFNHTGPGDIVADHTTTVSGSPISNEAFTLTYKVKVPATQAATTYSGTVVYTATAQY